MIYERSFRRRDRPVRFHPLRVSIRFRKRPFVEIHFAPIVFTTAVLGFPARSRNARSLSARIRRTRSSNTSTLIRTASLLPLKVYHHCLFGTRYDFLCANFTAFDQKTFICHFVSEVDCANSKKYWHRNDALYQVTTTTTTSTTTVAPPVTAAPTGRPSARDRLPPRRRPPPSRRRPQPYDYYEEDYYDDEYGRPSRDDYVEYDDRKYRRDREREYRERDRERDFRDRERYAGRSNRREPSRSREPPEDDARSRVRAPPDQGGRSTSRETDDADAYDRRAETRSRDALDERRYPDKR